jgi:hypothetical protein
MLSDTPALGDIFSDLKKKKLNNVVAWRSTISKVKYKNMNQL